MKGELIDLTKSLIEIRSESHDLEKVNEAHEFIKNYITSSVNCKVKVFEHNRVRSYYYYYNNKGPEICLCGHIDVVPDLDEGFVPWSDDVYIHGRGAGDMKGGVASIVLSFINNSDKNVSLLITGDEEVGSDNGAGFVCEHISPSAMIITEFSNNKLVLTEKGGVWVDLFVTGPGGHASRPWKAKNAVDILFDYVSRIRSEFEDLKEKKWVNTINVGSFIGGEVSSEELGFPNKIAQKASCRLDIRVVESSSVKEVFDMIQRKGFELNDELGEDYIVSSLIFKEIDMMHTPKDNLFVDLFLRSMEDNGLEKLIIKTAGGSDGRFFSKRGVPVLIFGPVSIDHHSTNEKVRIDSLIKTYEVINTFLKKV
ncbi:MAG: M20 family metallopeptidase [Candidatus Woesearchaeota archaeon]